MNNVFAEGFLHLGVTLAARILPFTALYLTNYTALPFPNPKRTLRYSLNGVLINDVFNVPDPGGPFPYGVLVEPP